jgi:hypothetical protein
MASSIEDMITAAARNAGLQKFQFHVYSGEATQPTAAQIKHLLTSCPSLTDLDLEYHTVGQDVLEVLLELGTSITTFQVNDIEVYASLADRQCSWKHLTLEKFPSLATLASLPLHSLQVLNIGRGRLWSYWQLDIPLGSTPAAEIPSLLRRATSNLAASPTWRAAPFSGVMLAADEENTLELSPQQCIPLLEALAPLGGPHIKSFYGWISGAGFVWGRPELQALGRSLNSQHLSRLDLSDCTLTPEFWAALDEVVPSLTSLTLRDTVTCSATDVAVYCAKRQPGKALTLRALAQAAHGAELRATLTARGITGVTVELL